MELRHLRYFVSVAELENVSRAALKLHVSQPALSRQIRDLEEELGLTLLERGPKAVRLTDAGRVFLVEARAVLDRAEQALKAARALATGGAEELHVGYAPTLTARLLPGALRQFQSALPKVRVRLHDLSTEEIVAGLHQGRLQIGISARPARKALRGLRFAELMREPLRLAVAPRHRLARRRTVTLEEAAREPLAAFSALEYPDYHEMLAALFANAPSQPRVSEEHDGISSLISGIEAGHGAAIVPDSTRCIAGPRLKLVPLMPEPEPIVVGLVSPESLSGAAEQFAEIVRTLALDTKRPRAQSV